MYTEERLFSYLQQFERDFARSTARVIDATEGGAAKRGATPMKLADAIRQFCGRPLKNVARDHPGGRWNRLPEAMDCLRRRRDEAGQIGQISRDTLPLLKEIKDNLQDQPRVNQLITRIDALRARMNELGPTYDLVTQLTQSTELNRFKADRSLSATKGLDANDRQRRQVARDIDNVRGVAEAAAEFQRLMDEVLDGLSARQSEIGATASTWPDSRREAA